MKLIADCGGTTTTWCLTDSAGEVRRFTTPGMNVVTLSPDDMDSLLRAELDTALGSEAQRIQQVYFYGAGCATDAICRQVRAVLERRIPGADVQVASDMLGMARALCGSAPGLVGIIGTGSNSCCYDGERIIDNVPSLGYILGDEGSGAYLGKMLVNKVIKRQLPDDLCHEFTARYALDVATVIQHVYRQPFANKYLASLSPFVRERIAHPAIRKLADDAFREFFVRNIVPYSQSAATSHLNLRTVHLGGSVAYHYRDIIGKVAADLGYTLGTVTDSPVDGLIAYHID